MGFFKKGITVVEQPKTNEINSTKIKYLNGYDAIREKLDEHNTLTVKPPVVVNGKSKK